MVLLVRIIDRLATAMLAFAALMLVLLVMRAAEVEADDLIIAALGFIALLVAMGGHWLVDRLAAWSASRPSRMAKSRIHPDIPDEAWQTGRKAARPPEHRS